MSVGLTAIVVNYNAGDDLGRALRAIAESCAGRSWEAVVVDNASSDGSEAVVDRFTPQVRLVRNPVNVGFGRAVNQAAGSSSARWLLLVNPDCRLDKGAVSVMGAVLEAEPDCAVVGPRILDTSGAVQGSARGDPDMFTGLFGRTSALRTMASRLPVARRDVVTEDALGLNRSSVVVDWVSGACMLIRRDAFEAAGGFDERFFLYWEDADLCRRLRRLGHHVRYVPGAVAVHDVGRSSRTARAESIRAFHESAYLYYATHVAPGAFNPKRLLARLILALRCRWKLLIPDP